MNPHPDIAQCVYEAKQGEQTAWNFLYQQFYPSLYATALKLCGHTPAAKDAVQDTFLIAFLQLKKLKDVQAFAGWLKKILIHNCYRSVQKEKRTGSERDIDAFSNHLADFAFEQELNNLTTKNKLFESLLYLPDELRSTVLLRYFSRFQSYEEMAAILATPVGTIRSRLHAARQKLAAVWQQCPERFNVLSEAEEWNYFYRNYFDNVHHDAGARKKLFNHMAPNLQAVFSSGQTDVGWKWLEKEIEEDNHFGSCYRTTHIISCGNISVVEGVNINSKEYPDRCPASTVFVLYRKKQKIQKLNMHNTPE